MFPSKIISIFLVLNTKHNSFLTVLITIQFIFFTFHTIQGREAISTVITITIIIAVGIILLTVLVIAKGFSILLIYTVRTINLSTTTVPDVSAGLGDRKVRALLAHSQSYFVVRGVS
jgi:hypothetical protein